MKLPYKEGTWFSVPLRQGGYAIGRVARHAPRGLIILAYLFGPKRETIPALEEADRLQADEAIGVWRISHLGLIDGTWPIIGDSLTWAREKWPTPPFIRKTGRHAWRVIYSDDNPNELVAEEPIPCETSGLEINALYGAKAAETVLSKILSWGIDTVLAIPRGVPMEQAVIVHLPLSDDGFGAFGEHQALYALQDQMTVAIHRAAAGEFDGDEFGEGECVLFMYGPDADKLFAAVAPLLASSALARGGYAIKRYGTAEDVEVRRIRVTWWCRQAE
jgi:hypothetical protein